MMLWSPGGLEIPVALQVVYEPGLLYYVGLGECIHVSSWGHDVRVHQYCGQRRLQVGSLQVVILQDSSHTTPTASGVLVRAFWQQYGSSPPSNYPPEYGFYAVATAYKHMCPIQTFLYLQVLSVAAHRPEGAML